jgi:hypothetical protein
MRHTHGKCDIIFKYVVLVWLYKNINIRAEIKTFFVVFCVFDAEIEAFQTM